MSPFRDRLVWSMLSGVIVLTWALIATGLFSAMLGRVVWLLLSIVASLLAARLVWFASKKMSDASKGLPHFVHWPKAIGWLGSLAVLFIVVTTAVGWGPGAWVRSVPSVQSILPSGDLFIAGGWAGWTYAALIATGVAAMIPWPQKTMKPEKPSRPSRKE